MNELPMPSDVKKESPTSPAGGVETTPIEPPSVKLIVRLFVIPAIIVAIAVGIMFLIGMMAGSPSNFEDALMRLKRPGGGRTADWLVGPGSKQRYIDAKTLVDKMKAGMNESERIEIAKDLTDIVDNFTKDDEGDVRHFLLLALGRAWQIEPRKADETDEQWNVRLMNSTAAIESRRQVIQTLLKYADAPQVQTRKAALLSMMYWAGRPEAKQLLPKLIAVVRDSQQEIDARIAAATVLGPVGDHDPAAIDALQWAMRNADERDIELVWSSALSLAEMNQPDVADTILQLLDRKYLSTIKYYDRETDPKNPSMRLLSEQEQQRILINTMIGAQHLKSSQKVQDAIANLTKTDPSPRVKAQGAQLGYLSGSIRSVESGHP